jgi:[ribosomal protein S5]-alanine N-acetyltransferase
MNGVFSLETARLRMREIGEDDLAFVFSMLGDAEVMRFYPKRLDRDESAAWIQRQRARYANDGHGLWLVEERESGLPVGQVGLAMQVVAGFPEPRYPEVGYLLHRPYWKRGYATEAAARVRDHAHRTLGYPNVISLIRPENEPSQAVARRIGMRVIGETIQASLPHLVFGASHEPSHSTDHPHDD